MNAEEARQVAKKARQDYAARQRQQAEAATEHTLQRVLTAIANAARCGNTGVVEGISKAGGEIYLTSLARHVSERLQAEGFRVRMDRNIRGILIRVDW